MSYYQPQPPRIRPVVWVSLAAALVALLAVGAYFLGRSDSGAAAGAGPATAAGPAEPAISWSVVGGQPVPASPVHGPRSTVGGRATGFSHDDLGAVLAAVNISYRLASEVGPQVYEATAREQCFGDLALTVEQIRNSFTTAPPGSTTPSEYWYRVTSGDPTGDLVLISTAAKTPQSVALGGYAGLDLTLRWVAGDWKLQVPVARPALIPNVAGFALLGRPNV